ncbi:MAG: KH domain-containing protein [Candidatus Saccharimonadales bacterium]
MAVSIDQQFVEYIVKSLVSNPDAVKIDRRIDEKGVLLELIVDPVDLGRVIGKRGATAQSLRTLLRALGTKNDARYNLKIVDTGPPPHSAAQPPADVPADEVAVEEKPEDAAPSNATADDTLPEDEPLKAEEIAPHSSEDEHDDTSHSSVISKTRAELAELDDLDV